MKQHEQILDYNQGILDERFVEKSLATGGKRFANYLIDTIAVTLIYFGFMVLYAFFFGASGGDFDESQGLLIYLIVYGIQLLYFFVMESSFQKTVGKMITKTTVVTVDGKKPTGMNILGRSLCRFIPFEAFSFLGSRAVGWHDSISKTHVINDVSTDLSG